MTGLRYPKLPGFVLALFFAALSSFALAGTAAAQSDGTPTQRAITENYQLASGDILKINVFGHGDISGDYEVDGTGQITFPLLGLVRAEGLTVEQLRVEIQQALNRDYLVEPRVSVEVLNYRPIYVLGQVNAPGSYPYSVGMTVRQAVALAGGYTRRADNDDMKLIRLENGIQKELEVQEEDTILPGDTLEVLRRFF